jgi:hypothetical protein
LFWDNVIANIGTPRSVNYVSLIVGSKVARCGFDSCSDAGGERLIVSVGQCHLYRAGVAPMMPIFRSDFVWQSFSIACLLGIALLRHVLLFGPASRRINLISDRTSRTRIS